jgi:hypothetical protein
VSDTGNSSTKSGSVFREGVWIPLVEGNVGSKDKALGNEVVESSLIGDIEGI